MDAMKPSEQIEWILADVNKFCMTRCRDRPKLVYVVSATDRSAMVDLARDITGKRPSSPDGRLWINASAGPVELVGDADKPAGLTPTRVYRCPCGELFLDDSSRSGKCAGCMMEQVAKTVRECGGTPDALPPGPSLVRKVRTPAGDIRITSDPTLKPGEFRLSNATWKVIGADFASAPDTHVISTVSVKNGVFHIDPDPPDLKEQRAAKVAERQRDEAMRRGWHGDNWLWCGCASKDGECPNATCTRHRLATPAFRGVDRTESPVRLSGTRLAPPPRPDGFAQSAIDAAKVAMLAAVPKRFK